MELTEAILKRRSIRKQKPDRISDDKIQKILEAARWAPSWANTQSWRFVVVRDNEIKEKLAATLGIHNPAAGAIKTSPVTLVICAEMGRGSFYGGKAVTDKGDYWYMFDAGIAMQNICLTAHSLGIGTVIVGLFDAQQAAAALNVPEGYCVVAMTPLGLPAEEGKAPPRRELAEIAFRDKFGAR
jgi:nitroreductase